MQIDQIGEGPGSPGPAPTDGGGVTDLSEAAVETANLADSTHDAMVQDSNPSMDTVSNSDAHRVEDER
jgi:hypothetical protein